MIFRDLIASDVQSCIEIMLADKARSSLWRGSFTEGFFSAALQHPAARFTVWESYLPSGKRAVVGFSWGVFVAMDCLRLLPNQRFEDAQGLAETRISRALCTGLPELPDLAQVARSNAEGSLCFLAFHPYQILDGIQNQSELGVADLPKAMAIGYLKYLIPALLWQLSGYRLDGLWLEAFGADTFKMLKSAGFESIDSQLMVGDDADPLLDGDSFGSILYLLRSNISVAADNKYFLFYGPGPIFRFTLTQQQLLLCALQGYSDSQIASILQLQPETIKKCWSTIYQRVSDNMPGFFFQSDSMNESAACNVRGSEKRRVLLDYLRSHYEELRPFERTIEGTAVNSQIRRGAHHEFSIGPSKRRRCMSITA